MAVRRKLYYVSVNFNFRLSRTISLSSQSHDQLASQIALKTSAATHSRWLSSVSLRECYIDGDNADHRRTEFRPDPAYQKFAGS